MLHTLVVVLHTQQVIPKQPEKHFLDEQGLIRRELRLALKLGVRVPVKPGLDVGYQKLNIFKQPAPKAARKLIAEGREDHAYNVGLRVVAVHPFCVIKQTFDGRALLSYAPFPL